MSRWMEHLWGFALGFVIFLVGLIGLVSYTGLKIIDILIPLPIPEELCPLVSIIFVIIGIVIMVTSSSG